MPQTRPEKLAEISGKSAGGLVALVIPQVPYHPMPSNMAAKFPNLDQWNRDQFKALADWRERTNAVFARLPAAPTP